MIDLSVSTTFISDGEPLRKALNQCEQAEIQSVEIGSNHCFEENYNYLLDYPFQYLIHNYFPIPKDTFVLNIASLDENIRNRSILHINRAIDFCSKIGSSLYTFHPGFITDPKGSNISYQNYDFQWDENQIQNSNYDKAIYFMYNSLDEVVTYAKSQTIQVAIETEGSLKKKNHLLMQRPDEYEEFMAKYSSADIGINLNIGHLNLAANAFDFVRSEFVDLVQDYIVAMELSHNDGLEDQHYPLDEKGWYWPLILDSRLENAFKILEFRNTKIERIREVMELFVRKLSDV